MGERGHGLTLTPPEPKRRRRAKGFDPDEPERAVLDAVMCELHRCRALAGWARKGWTVSAAHCEQLLARHREGMSLTEALEAVRATCWMDARSDFSEKLADGTHAHLTRIFRLGDGESRGGRAAKIERWVEEWREAGRPDPSPHRPAKRLGNGGAFVPRGKYTEL